MTRVAELWNRLTDAEKNAAWYACRHTLGDPGAELIIALAAHAETVAEPAGPAQTCHDCGHEFNGRPLARPIEINGSRRVEWLDADCWNAWLMGRWFGSPVPGDTCQPFPTPLPAKEQP